MLEFTKISGPDDAGTITYEVAFPKGLTIDSLVHFLTCPINPMYRNEWGFLFHDESSSGSMIMKYTHNHIQWLDNRNTKYFPQIITRLTAMKYCNKDNRMDYIFEVEGDTPVNPEKRGVEHLKKNKGNWDELVEINLAFRSEKCEETKAAPMIQTTTKVCTCCKEIFYYGLSSSNSSICARCRIKNCTEGPHECIIGHLTTKHINCNVSFNDLLRRQEDAQRLLKTILYEGASPETIQEAITYLEDTLVMNVINHSSLTRHKHCVFCGGEMNWDRLQEMAILASKPEEDQDCTNASNEEVHKCIIGQLDLEECQTLVTIDDLYDREDEVLKLLKYRIENNSVDAVIRASESLTDSLVIKILEDDSSLHHFKHCPECGEWIKWDALLNDARTRMHKEKT